MKHFLLPLSKTLSVFISNSRNSPSCALDCQLYVVHHSILLFSALHHLKRKGIVCSQTTERSFLRRYSAFPLDTNVDFSNMYFDTILWNTGSCYIRYKSIIEICSRVTFTLDGICFSVSNFSDVVKHLKRLKVEKYTEMPGGIICCPGGLPVVVIFVAYGSRIVIRLDYFQADLRHRIGNFLFTPTQVWATPVLLRVETSRPRSQTTPAGGDPWAKVEVKKTFRLWSLTMPPATTVKVSSCVRETWDASPNNEGVQHRSQLGSFVLLVI